MSRKGRRQKLKNGSEFDLIYCKRFYNFRSGVAKWIKRKMNKRFRREQKNEINNQEGEY